MTFRNLSKSDYDTLKSTMQRVRPDSFGPRRDALHWLMVLSITTILHFGIAGNAWLIVLYLMVVDYWWLRLSWFGFRLISDWIMDASLRDMTINGEPLLPYAKSFGCETATEADMEHLSKLPAAHSVIEEIRAQGRPVTKLEHHCFINQNN